MTFDDAYTNYITKRNNLREVQGELDKLGNERRRISKEIKAKHREYKTKHRELVDAMGQLVPELNKEVQAHPFPADMTDVLLDNEKEE